MRQNSAAGSGAGKQDGAGKQSRRRFIVIAWVGIALFAVIEALWVVFDFLHPGGAAPVGDTALTIAGPIERFAKGSVTAFPEGRFYLVRLDDGGFIALARECTHLGCTVPWVAAEARFVCPCHSSAFDIHGEVLSRPAPRPLDVYAIRIENEIVKVDTSSPIRRDSFNQSQVART